MATKKQRRRRQKGKRHDYEYVWVDEEGREIEVAEDAVPERVRHVQRTNGRRAAGRAATSARGIQPPSWRRVLKRALIFVPLMFVAISILPGGDDLTTAQKGIVTAQWALILIPFMYLMEVVSYRVWKRRSAKADAPSPKR